MKKKKIDYYLLLSILITIVGFSILMILRKTYPFGSNIINLLDFDDGYIPVYYKLWDVLHFKSTAYFDWNLGGGLNAFGSLIGNGFISPLCWIIALFPRSSIPYTISYVFLLKLVFVTVMAYIGIGKIFPETKGKYKMLFSLLYTFNAFMFLMCTNLLYLDSIAIFPLFVYSLKELLEKGHWKLYTVLLTATLLMSYYIAWLDLIFLVGTSGLYLIIMKTDNKKEKAVKVLLCTLLSLAISCVLFLPGFMFARSSARMANNTSNAGIFDFFNDKIIYLFTLVIPFILTIKQLFIKKDKRLNIFIISMLLFLLLGVVFEPINALWHTGSHSGFPFRYGYQVYMFTILVSVYYINNNYKKNKETSNIRLIIPIFLILNLAFLFIKTCPSMDETNNFINGLIFDRHLYLLYFIVFLIIATYLFILKNSEKKAYALTIALFVVQSIGFGYLFIQPFEDESSPLMQEIKEKFNLVNDGYNYSMILENSNVNFPYILEVPSIENRIHFIQQNEIDQRNYFGFNGKDTMVRSSGGNIFTNALVQNKYYISESKLNDKYYDLIEEKDNMYYYKTKYNLSYLIPYNGKEYNEEEEDFFINSNNIYKSIFDGKKPIFNKVNISNNSFVVCKGKTYDIVVKKELSRLFKLDYEEGTISDYNEFNSDRFGLLVSFESNVDGKIKIVADDNVEYTIYETDFDEYSKFINMYGNRDVSVETSGSTKTYTYNALEDETILLPINYTDNYIIKVNGEVVDYSCNLYNMISINIHKGLNKIDVTYNQKWFGLGIKISLVSLALMAIVLLINKKFKLLEKGLVVWPLFILSCILFAFLIIKIYVLTFI